MLEKTNLMPVLYVALLMTATPANAQTSRVDELLRENPAEPVVLAIQESNPRTPAEIMRATRTMINIGRKDLAKRYLEQLTAQNLEPAVLVALHDRFGSSWFIRLGHDKDLLPTGAELAQAVVDAAGHAARDKKRIAEWIGQLDSEVEEIRYRAIANLRRAATAAIEPLLGVLADDGQAAIHKTARTILLDLGPTAVDPLLAVSDATDPVLRIHAIRLLGQLRNWRAINYLLGPALSLNELAHVQLAAREAFEQIVGAPPERWEAEHMLGRQLDQLRSGDIGVAVDDRNQIQRWHWNRDQQLLRFETLDVDLARAEMAARFAQDLTNLHPQSRAYQLEALGATITAAKLAGGLDQPLSAETRQIAADAGVGDVEAVLGQSLAGRETAAAIATIEMLQVIGTEQLLCAAAGRPRALVRALDYPDRRVRFVAANAIMELNPQSPYAGSSTLIETLVHLAGVTGARGALVCFPRTERGNDIGGFLRQLGFHTDIVGNGKQLFRHATQFSDYEFVLISDATSGPEVSQLVQSLRLDPRTADLPVALMARLGNIERIGRIANEDPLILAIPEPHSADAIQFYVQDLLSLQGRHYVPAAERLRQAKKALRWLIHIAKDHKRYGFYDVLCWQTHLEPAIYVPELFAEAAHLLGLLGSPSAQRALVNLASNHVLPVRQRHTAVDALQIAINRRGVLLSTAEIRAQYDRYNASRNLDHETQAVLGAILDSLESRQRRSRKS